MGKVPKDRQGHIHLKFKLKRESLPENQGVVRHEKNKTYYFLACGHWHYFAVVFQPCHSLGVLAGNIISSRPNNHRRPEPVLAKAGHPVKILAGNRDKLAI